MGHNILFAVLDWGLGHATRSLPVIHELENQGCEVMIASDGAALEFLKQELPGRKFHELPGYNVRYHRLWPVYLALLPFSFRLPSIVKREWLETDRILAREGINCIISDNRYGCYSTAVRSIMITHQLSLAAAGFWSALDFSIDMNVDMLKCFDEIWVPDFPGSTLTGKMSKSRFHAPKFVGPLTTMKPETLPSELDVLVVLSGPEPQRSLLEEILNAQVQSSSLRYLLVRGVADSGRKDLPHAVNFLGRKELNQAFNRSALIISRPGYSTIMDLAVTGKRAIFIPTPGQPEQLYLAKEMKRKGIAYYEAQSIFDLKRALSVASKYKGFTATVAGDYLTKAVSDLLGSL